MTRSRLAALVFSVILGVGGAVVVASPAEAIGLPCGRVCDLKDPHTYRVRLPPVQVPDNYIICDWDARTVESAVLPTASPVYLYLRYSPSCETTWVRLGGGPAYLGITWHFSQYLNGVLRTQTSRYAPPGLWTVMLDDHNLLNWACQDYYDNEDDAAADRNRHRSCTGKY
jgi:hypothetical protein